MKKIFTILITLITYIMLLVSTINAYINVKIKKLIGKITYEKIAKMIQ